MQTTVEHIEYSINAAYPMSLVGSLRGVQANPEPCNSNSINTSAEPAPTKQEATCATIPQTTMESLKGIEQYILFGPHSHSCIVD